MEFFSMPEDSPQKDNLPKSTTSSEDQQKKAGNCCSLSRLIFIVCISIIGLVVLNFISCSFMIPGSIQRSHLLGGLKTIPSLDCKETQKGGYETLITVLTTVIALKAKFD